MFSHACETVQTWERRRLRRVAGERGQRVKEAAAEPARGALAGGPQTCTASLPASSSETPCKSGCLIPLQWLAKTNEWLITVVNWGEACAAY